MRLSNNYACPSLYIGGVITDTGNRDYFHDLPGTRTNVGRFSPCTCLDLPPRPTPTSELEKHRVGSIGHINGLLRVDMLADYVDWAC